ISGANTSHCASVKTCGLLPSIISGRWGNTQGLTGPRSCQSLSSALLLDPVHGGGHAEHTHEGAGGLLISGRNRMPLLEPRPETLDPIAISVDPRRAGHGRFATLGRDRRACAEVQMRSRKAWLA